MKKNIALVAGGNSSEYGVSINSAAQIEAVLDTNRYNIYKVVIRGDDWVVSSPMACDIPVDKSDFSFRLNNQKTSFHCALIIIHGTPGENGILQGYFEMLNIPYTTAGILASSLTFNKVFTKNYLKPFNIPTANYVLVTQKHRPATQEILDKTGLPCFVKPNKGGSSFGITKVKSEEQLQPAIDKAFEEDNEVLIEQFLEGTELTCGVLKTRGKTYLLPPTEIVSKNEFFDYEAKYTKGMADEITPARISKALEKEIQERSSFIYDTLNMKGLIRVDYIYANNTLYFMEVNTTPGMSAASIVPQQVEAAGYDLGELFGEIIEDALLQH
ncbi:MAG: D-alanine--D-alanine ligase [Bacteroidales bacterium]